MYAKEIGCKVVDFIRLGCNEVGGSCKYGNEPSVGFYENGFINLTSFLLMI
jgi:hypothetical protein